MSLVRLAHVNFFCCNCHFWCVYWANKWWWWRNNFVILLTVSCVGYTVQFISVLYYETVGSQAG